MSDPVASAPVPSTSFKSYSILNNKETPVPSLPSSSVLSGHNLLEQVGTLTVSASSTSSSATAKVDASKKSSTTSSPSKGVSITDIHYDGDVPKTESDEYVVISNTGKDSVDVSGYFIYVATSGTQGPSFYFPKGSVIKSGASVKVYTNEVHKESGGYSWESGKAIWNNKGGLGVLKNADGKKLGEFKY